MAASSFLFGDGDRVRCWGELVVARDGLWLDLARVSNLLIEPPGSHSERSVRLTGFAAEELTRTAEHTPRHVHVLGTWSNNMIAVESWRAVDDAERELWHPAHAQPPCSPPPEGWSTGKPRPYDMGDLELTGAAVGHAVFQPTPTQQVIVVAATDLQAVIRHLAPQLPGRLCVVQSRCSKHELDHAHHTLAVHFDDWQLESLASAEIDDVGQPFIAASVTRVSRQLATWIDTLPPDLLRLDVAITPA